MKARHEFRYENDYYAYLHSIYMIEAMKAVITQNMMFCETGELDYNNQPQEVYKRAKSYADYFVDKIATKQ